MQRVEIEGLNPQESAINCIEWSVDNSHLAVGCDEGVLKYYELARTAENKVDYRSPMEIVCDLSGNHDCVNRVDISPGKSLLVSVGSDYSANLFDLKLKKSIKRLTFSDKDYRDHKGIQDNSPFQIRGCAFSPEGSTLFLLAA